MNILLALFYAIITIVGFILGFILGHQIRIRNYFHHGVLNNIIILTLIIILGMFYSMFISVCYFMLITIIGWVACEYIVLVTDYV